jgi:arginyl-tRNA synthetase
MTLRQELQCRLADALQRAGLLKEDGPQCVVAPASDSRFGDYQSNIAMVLAKVQRCNPREVAAKIVEAFEPGGLCGKPEIAGAGFLNFHVRPEVLAARVKELLADPMLGTPPAAQPRTIIVDFSSPNVAKPMHVGHIRSTILGDSLVRIARFLGHEVIADNHLGDWGTQFGKIIYGWKHLLDRRKLENDPIAELLRLYRDVNALEAADPAVAVAVREELVRLQQGDEENLGIWRQTVELSWGEFERLYEVLDIRFDEHLGESFYNERLAPLVDRLLAAGHAQISEGAACIFFPENPELADKPCLIRKSDGGFLYATTDLATLEYRQERWNPDAVWYVTGAPQSLHFKQIFAASQHLGIKAELRHVAFGSILGEDRKIMKTRSGENVELGAVLDEAVSRAAELVRQKNEGLPDAEVETLSQIIGLGAVKYAELSQHRLTDYVFSWDKMLAFQGNTAPYLQNAFVRIRSIFRRTTESWHPPTDPPSLNEPEEKSLALKLNQFGEVLPEVLEDFRPNLLANYLYELANTFHTFYEKCPVLKADERVRDDRLLLCEVCARVLSVGLSLLGIRCPEKM